MNRCVGASLAALALGACAAVTPPAQSLPSCLEQPRSCDPAQLGDRDREALYAHLAKAHYEECLSGARCNESALTSVQRKAVREAVAGLNVSACLSGEAQCRLEDLDMQQRAAVSDAAAQRNFSRCLAGLRSCDPGSLTPDQTEAMREARRQRNFAGCMNSVGTLLACEPGELSPEQAARVRQRDLEANLFVCANSLIGCNEDWLSDTQRETFAARRARLAR